MVIQQGDLFWIDLGEPVGSVPGYRRPCVVIQNNTFNRSAIQTVVVCGITSNLNRANASGNVLLRLGEAGLPKPSVVNVSQMFTVDKNQLEEYIGALSAERVREIVEGVHRLTEPSESD